MTLERGERRAIDDAATAVVQVAAGIERDHPRGSGESNVALLRTEGTDPASSKSSRKAATSSGAGVVSVR